MIPPVPGLGSKRASREGADFAEVTNLKMDNVDLDLQTGGPLILEVAYYK